MEKTSGANTNKISETMPDQHNGLMTIEYYTDPLCCWSWAFEPVLDQILEKYAEIHEFKVMLGGLISDWKHFNDPINDINRPSQMGPLWMLVSQTTGVATNPDIWLKTPPVSSYPACIAVKCAQIQSSAAGNKLLKALRKAVMIENVDISSNSEILSIAETTFDDNSDFNFLKFKTDLLSGEGIKDFRHDLQLKEMNNVSRLPALILKDLSGNGRILYGYRPFDVLDSVIKDFIENHLNLKI